MSSATSEIYGGCRILEATRKAVRYSAAAFQALQSARPAVAKTQLDFGTGDGMFVRKFRERGATVDAVDGKNLIAIAERPNR